jgi:hypothetical protein
MVGAESAVRFREVTERFWLLRLVTEVREDGLYVRLAPLQRNLRHVPASDVDTLRETTYDSSAYDGWHWGFRRTGGGHRVYRLSGKQGVEVVRASGERWFIGSQRSGELVAALENCLSGTAGDAPS